MTYLFDTDHISILQTQAGTDYDALVARMATISLTDVAYSIISLQEQLLGCHTYLSRARTSTHLVRGYEMLRRAFQDFSAVALIDFDSTAGATFDSLIRLRIRISTMDLRIAAIALSQGLILLTRNARDFSKVPGLITEDWTI